MLYLLARKQGNSIQPVAQHLRSIGTGMYTDSRNRLSDRGVYLIAETLNHWQEEARIHGAGAVAVVGTHIFRMITNSAEACTAIQQKTGLDVEVLSGEDEARFGFYGAVSGRGIKGFLTVLDVGGGSTELVVSEYGSIISAHSVELGAVTGTSAFLRRDPPAHGEIAALRAYAAEQLRSRPELRLKKPDTLVCTGGTVTTLAALYHGLETYDGKIVHGTLLEHRFIEEKLAELCSCTMEQRKALLTIDPKRADVIVAGTAILCALLDCMGAESCFVSDRGLRFGIAMRELSCIPESG